MGKPARLLPFVLLLFVAALVACGGSDGAAIDTGDAAPAPDGAASAADAGTDATLRDGAASSAEIAPSSLDFGLVDCGGAVTQTVTIKNGGTAPLAWQATVGGSQVFTVAEPSSGTLDAGATASLTVAARVDGTATAGARSAAILTITTDDAAHPSAAVPLAATAAGAAFALKPSAASFGLVSVGTSGVLGLTLTNVGNKGATLHASAPADPQFQVTWQGAPADVTVAPGATMPGLTATYTPGAVSSAASTAPLVATGAVCGGGSSSAIALTGAGTSGSFGYAPALLDFGDTDCGTKAPAKTITITNSGNQAFTWTATLGQGAASPFTLSFASTTVPPNGTGTITVTPKAIPTAASTASNGFGDTVSIDVTAGIPNEPTHKVDLVQTAYGAVIRFTPAGAIAFGDTPLMTTASAPLSVENAGNAPASITAQVTGSPAFGLTIAALGVVAPGDVVGDSVTFTPITTGVQNAQLSLVAGAADVLCAPLPASPSVSGRGTNGVISLSASSVAFGAVDCGARAPAQVVTVRNTGTSAFTWSAALATGTSFALATAGTTLQPAGQPGDTGTITITPIAIPQTSAVTPNLYADTVTVTTDIVGDAPHVVPLKMTAHGAILTASTADIEFGGVVATTSALQQFSVTNAGNATASVTFAHASTVFDVTPAPGVVVASTATPFTASFLPTAQGPYADAATFTVPAGTPLCAPLPAPITLGGTGTPPTVGVAPTNLDFSLVPCGASAPPQTVTLQNTGTASMTYIASVTAGAAFYGLGSAGGTIAAGGFFDLVVTPVQVPPTSATTADLYAGQITITTSSPGDTPHVVSLHETAQGARLSWDVTQLDFGGVQVGQTAGLPLALTNAGNLTANVTFGGFTSPPFTVAPSSSPVVGGAPALAVTATFAPAAPGAVAGQTIAITTSEPLCAPLPPAVTLSATGL
jgi:Viral BACON domain